MSDTGHVPVGLLAPETLTGIIKHVCETGVLEVSADQLVLEDFLSEHIRPMSDTGWWYHHLSTADFGTVVCGSVLHRWLVLDMMRELSHTVSDSVLDLCLWWVHQPFVVLDDTDSILVRAIREPQNILFLSSSTVGDWRATWRLCLLIRIVEHLPEIHPYTSDEILCAGFR